MNTTNDPPAIQLERTVTEHPSNVSLVSWINWCQQYLKGWAAKVQGLEAKVQGLEATTNQKLASMEEMADKMLRSGEAMASSRVPNAQSRLEALEKTCEDVDFPLKHVRPFRTTLR